MPVTSDGLTGPQRAFANKLIEGMKPGLAYQYAYPKSSLKGIALSVEANRLGKLKKVRAYVDAALREHREEVLLTRDKKRQILGGIALNKFEKSMPRIAAIKEDNAMTGDAAPVRIEGEITLHAVFLALKATTGLPDGAEIKRMKHAEPAQALTTAMERAG